MKRVLFVLLLSFLFAALMGCDSVIFENKVSEGMAEDRTEQNITNVEDFENTIDKRICDDPEDITESTVVDNDSGAVSEGRLYFGSSKNKALLLSADGVMTWLYAKDESVFDRFETGDLVRVSHGGVMMSYPGQTNISKIALLEDGDISSFTEEEIAILEAVIDGFE